jgi:hypothetical protein
MERRISQAVKLLASLPVDDKNILNSECAPIHERWSAFAVCQLPFFQTENFMNIRCRVHKAQMDEALMIDGEPPSQQKHWISHEIGNKVIPKLHACIRATQSLMQGQRLHQQDTSALGHRILSIETKLDILLQHLKTPPNLSSSSEEDDEDEGTLYVPPTPTQSLPNSFFTSSPTPVRADWFKLSFDPAKNSKGVARKKAPPQKVINRPFSGDNISAHDYWNEYYHGSPGKPALKSLEDNYGSSWRSDSKFKRLDGKKGTALKSGWSLQKPIYDYIEFLMVTHPEEVAVAMVQEVFDCFPYKHSKKPMLVKCKKEFVLRWGSLYNFVSPVSPSPTDRVGTTDVFIPTDSAMTPPPTVDSFHGVPPADAVVDDSSGLV